MSGHDKRDNVFPTRQTEQLYQTKLAGAKTGYDLLKKKRDALRKEHRSMAAAIFKTKQALQGASGNSYFAIDDAVWSAGEFKRKLVNGTYTTPAVQVAVKHDNVAGVALPRFRVIRGELEARADLGLAGGGRDIARAQRQWSSLLTLLVRLAGLQTQFQALDKAIKLTSRRVNALENVLIPRFSATIKYVKSELDEMEREDIYRIKKVLEVKRRKLAEEAATRQAFHGADAPGEAATAAGGAAVVVDADIPAEFAGFSAADDESEDEEANLFG
ncbi:vha-14 [Symbiodinium sp. KB8]|nr:vha-14 [Symbiodinium sp. KB8]